MSMLPEAQALISQLRHEIPLTAAMQIGVSAYDGRSLTLTAPLAANVNDKGTAFAGSIAALANLTGWALLMLWAEERFGECQVAIYRSEMEYRKPLRTGFTATTALPVESSLQYLADALGEKGRGKITLQIELSGNDGLAVTMSAGYAVWLVE
jgi:thioesterase domain-containing protein